MSIAEVKTYLYSLINLADFAQRNGKQELFEATMRALMIAIRECE